MKRNLLTLAAIALTGVARTPLRAQVPTCDVVGTWQLESFRVNGQSQSFPRPHIKLVTATHYAVIRQLADSMPNPADTTQRVQRPGSLIWSLAGRYTVSGSQYTEEIQLASDSPRTLVGRTLTATCKVENDIWTHTFVLTGTAQPMNYEERYRRIGR